jgi:acid phosphatase type 7
VRVSASGLRPRARIAARLGGTHAGAGRAGRRGRLRLAVAVPALPAGVHPLTLRGRGVRVRLRFTVLAPPPPPPAPAPAPPPAPAPAPPPAAPPPVVAAAGDIACSPSAQTFNGGNGGPVSCRQAATADAVASIAPAAVLPLGDTQYDFASPAEYAASYDRSWGRFNGIAHPVPGGEEYNTPGASGYFGYFGASAGDPSRGYYSFDLGTWHLIALDGMCDQVAGGCAAGSPQEQWLRADLAAHPAQCTLAYWHRPRFTSGTAPQATDTNAFWDDLYEAGADVVLGANNHVYERFAPQRVGPPNPTTGQRSAVADPERGLREFVVGTGGRSLQGLPADRPNLEVRDNSSFGVLALTLRPDGYDWRFVPAAGGGFTDSGSAACH